MMTTIGIEVIDEQEYLVSDLRTTMDVTEAAAVLRIHVSTIYRLAQQRTIPAFKVGRSWRFHPTALENWMLAQAAAHLRKP